jgi:hypothetical protein
LTVTRPLSPGCVPAVAPSVPGVPRGGVAEPLPASSSGPNFIRLGASVLITGSSGVFGGATAAFGGSGSPIQLPKSRFIHIKLMFGFRPG